MHNSSEWLSFTPILLAKHKAGFEPLGNPKHEAKLNKIVLPSGSVALEISMLLKHVPEPVGRRLGVPFERIEVNVDDAKLGRVS